MGIAEELERLEKLRHAGSLSEAEYTIAKERVLSGDVGTGGLPQSAANSSAGKRLPGDVYLASDEHLVTYFRAKRGFDRFMLQFLGLFMMIFIITIPVSILMLRNLPPKKSWYYLTTHRAILATDRTITELYYSEMDGYQALYVKGRWKVVVGSYDGKKPGLLRSWHKIVNFMDIGDAKDEFMSVLEIADRERRPITEMYEYQGQIDWS